jgi:sigma-E factor negative regulatory protein RseC
LPVAVTCYKPTMDAPQGRILEVNGDRARVLVDGDSACPRCASGRGCGAGLIGGRARMRELELRVDKNLGLNPGDTVWLELPPARLVEAATCGYGLPLAGILVALAIAQLVNGPIGDAAAVTLALTGLIAGGIGGRLLLARNTSLQRLCPTIGGRVA